MFCSANVWRTIDLVTFTLPTEYTSVPEYWLANATVMLPICVAATLAGLNVAAPKYGPVVWYIGPENAAPEGRSDATNQRAVLSVPYTKSVAKITSFCWMKFTPQPLSDG